MPSTHCLCLVMFQCPCAFAVILVAKSDEENMYRQRYWMCANLAFEPTLRQRHINKMVENWCCVIIILCHMKSCIVYLVCNIWMYCSPSTAQWFWVVDRYWDQAGRQGVDAETVTVGGRGQEDDGEETQRGGSRKGAQGRWGKEACCFAQGGEREEAWACAPSEGSDGGESRYPEEWKVASLHSVVFITC